MTRASLPLLATLLLAGAFAAESGAEGALCTPWAGELAPLPFVSDSDPLRAAWAELRADQLAALAWELEPHSRTLAHRVWRHVACLDPERLELVHALTRTAPVRWARPPILKAEEPLSGRGGTPTEPAGEWRWDLGEPIRVVTTRIPSPPQGGDRRSVAPLVAEQIEAAERALQEARFELALARADRAKRLLGPDGRRSERAALEVLTATAEIALGREDAARQSLERALRARADLRLDPTRHSPKLIRLFEAVRRGNGPQP